MNGPIELNKRPPTAAVSFFVAGTPRPKGSVDSLRRQQNAHLLDPRAPKRWASPGETDGVQIEVEALEEKDGVR